MGAPDALGNVERLRSQLEYNLHKLQAALRYWQISEAEYEGLKEEVEDLGENAGDVDLSRTAEETEGEVLVRKEIDEIFGLDKGRPREPKQILGLLDRRVDYTHRNVESLNKQLEDAERKLAQLDALGESENPAESGLPVQDIYEELDEDGNVISSRIGKPEEAEPQIMRALENAGIRKHDLAQGSQLKPDESKHANVETEHDQRDVKPQLEQEQGSGLPPVGDGKTPETSTRVSSIREQEPRATSVPATHPSANNASSALDRKPPSSVPTKPTSAHLQDVAKHSFPNGERVVEVNSDDEEVAETAPKAPLEESPEDARLRAQMLEYSMREVGEIVAQIDLDEGDDDEDRATDSGTAEFASDEDEEIGGDEGFDLDETDDEDEYGLNRSSNMGEAYRKEMMELEKRLNARMFQNVGPNPNHEALEPSTEQRSARGPVSSANLEHNTTTLPERPAKDKSVRFAESLDVAPEPKRPTEKSRQTKATRKGDVDHHSGSAVRDNVIERAPPPQAADVQTAPAKKMSRFKAARQQSAAESTPEVKPHRSSANPLANNIIERPASGRTTAPSEDDQFDAEIQQRQLKREYYDYRNRQVQREGGFARFGRQDEGEAEVSDEDEGGRKMSLFMKARAEGWDAGRRRGAV